MSLINFAISNDILVARFDSMCLEGKGMDAKITQSAVSQLGAYASYSKSAVTRKETEGGASPGAVVELGGGTAKVSAAAYGPTVEAMKKEAEARYENLRAMVRELIARQYGVAIPAGETAPAITPEAIEQAQTDIAAGGYYSPEATAGRILDFAKALSGGDASKFNLLKDAVEKGFADVKDMLGGELPEISRKTYDLVKQGFDAWAKELGIAGTSAGDEAAG
jgi:hypothetical protein